MNYSYAKNELMGEEQLVIRAEKDSKFIPYIIDTIAYNPQLNILQPVYKEIDGGTTYLYDISKMISLKDFLYNHEVEVTIIRKILKSIIESIQKSKNYLVAMDKFVLTSDFIFIDDSLENVKLVVVPCEKPVFEDTEQAFKELVVDIVFNLAVYSEKGDGFIEDLLNLLKKDFTIENLKELCFRNEKSPDEVEKQVAESVPVPEEMRMPEAVRELFEEEPQGMGKTKQRKENSKEKNKNLTFSVKFLFLQNIRQHLACCYLLKFYTIS